MTTPFVVDDVPVPEKIIKTRELKRTLTKDLKRGVTYWLNFSYTYYGGTPVKYVRTLKSPYFSKGDVEGKDAHGEVFVVHKKSWLYAEDPREQEVDNEINKL